MRASDIDLMTINDAEGIMTAKRNDSYFSGAMTATFSGHMTMNDSTAKRERVSKEG